MRPQLLWLGPVRLPFLLLTPACLALALACVQQVQGHVNGVQAVWVVLGALAAHVSVNAFNEYLDFRSGLDALTQRTPFSGGSGVLPAHPELARLTLVMAVLSLLLCMGVGLYFVALRGPALLPIGLTGVALVLAYTRWVTRHAWLCLLAPGLGFGPLMLLGTQIALTGHASAGVAAASLVPFFLVNNLLLLNQFPDEQADRHVGRRHLLVIAGPVVGSHWYATLNIVAFASLALSVGAGGLPTGALLGLLGLGLAVPATRDVLRHARDVSQLLPAMGRHVALTLITPLLMAAGILLL